MNYSGREPLAGEYIKSKNRNQCKVVFFETSFLSKSDSKVNDMLTEYSDSI